MSTVDNNPIASYKIINREKQIKNAQKTLKQKENKQKLIKDLKDSIQNDLNSYEDLMWSLIDESLQNKSQKWLKQILYGK